MWLISLLSPIFYILLPLSSVDFFSIEKNVISFLVLGIVPGTNIQFDFYFLTIGLIIGMLSIMPILLLKNNKIGHLQKIFLQHKQNRFKNISI
jgi:hypothetical protein